MFALSVLNQYYPFWVNLVQKGEIVSLKWDWVPNWVQKFFYTEFDANFHFSCFWLKTPFLGKIVLKNQKLSGFWSWYVTFAIWNRCKKTLWFKMMNMWKIFLFYIMQKMSNLFVLHYKLKKILKQFFQLIANIYKCKDDNKILHNSYSCILPKTRCSRLNLR